jgi:hypothetical protein
MVVEELRVVDAHHFTLLRHEQDACRGIDRRGGNAVAFMTDDLFLAITDIYGRLEYLNLLLGKLSSTKTADEFFRLAGEHRAAHDLHSAATHHLAIAGTYVFHLYFVFFRDKYTKKLKIKSEE